MGRVAYEKNKTETEGTVGHEIFAGVYFCGMAIFWRLAGTNFCNWDRVVFIAGNYYM